MKKIRFSISFILVLLLVALMSLAAVASTITVESVASTSDTELASLKASGDGLFLGWYTSEAAALSLDSEGVAADGHNGTLYGALLETDGSEIELVGVQMRTEEPYGIRFLAKVDKELIDTIESVNALNRAGKSGSLTPKNEHATDIGYGMVLAIDVETTGTLTKRSGGVVEDGACVPGAYTFSEDDTSITYSATVIGTPVASLADKIAARPYVTYADANGNTHTVYYTESSSANSAYAASVYDVASAIANDADASDTDKSAAEGLLTTYLGSAYTTKVSIESLNTYSENNSYAANGGNSYIELDRSTMVTLDESDHSRYQNAFYPRISKVKDDLYLMTLNYAQEGMHIYYVTSTDGENWGAPSILYNASKNTFTYTSGSLKGTTDAYYAATADHCVLDDGTILCVYSRRPCSGYSLKEYASLSTLELVKGTVKGSTITWSEPVSIYHGQNWEPEIIQRSDGTVEIYWTHIAPMLYLYGFQDSMRSSGVAMISSTDGGDTWTPSVTSAPYAAKRIYQFPAGSLTINNKSVTFVHGQMAGVVELAAGDKLMLVAETRTIDRSYHCISKAYSNVDCEWTELGISETGPSNTASDVFRGAAPTLMRFVSGEILLTYNNSSMLYTRLLNNRGTNMSTAYESNIFYNNSETDGGFWSASAPIDSHTAILAMSYKRYKGVASETVTDDEGNESTVLHNTTVVGKVRLNHTIVATKKNMVADGNLQEWKSITDALFVGSLSKSVQAAYRFAYDDDYIYAAIDRTDNSNNKEDTNYVMIATDSGYVKAEISYGDYTLPEGVTGGTKNASGGRVYELAFDREALGLTGDTIYVCPGFTDANTGVDDRINGTYISDTSTWIKIILD